MSLRLAARYAKAIYEVAQDNNNGTKVLESMKEVAETIKDNHDLDSFLKNVMVSHEDKESVLNKIFTTAPKEVKQSFKLLKNNKRFAITQLVANEYVLLAKKHQNIQDVYVTTAISLDKNLEDQILAVAKTMTTCQINLISQIDKGIIGGFVIRINDQEYNASVVRKLQQIKKEILVS